MPIRLVVFDVGETLVDESRMWGEWADWLGVTRLTFFAAMGAVIAARRHHSEAFALVRPGIDIAAERERRAAAGTLTRIERRDLYPDAEPVLAQLRAGGLRIGLAGNQPPAGEADIRALGLPVEFVGSSGRWGVEKPDPAFFAYIIGEAGIPAGDIAYVGDRIDNDILPAMAAGMRGIFIRRGPWGVVQASRPEAARLGRRIESLDELPAVLGLR